MGNGPEALPAEPSGFDLRQWHVEPTRNLLSDGERSVTIEPKMMDVLVFLAACGGRVVTKEEIAGAVWADTFVTESVVTRAIAGLRKALGDDARAPRFIETIARRGYRLVIEPVPSPAELGGPGAASGLGGTPAARKADVAPIDSLPTAPRQRSRAAFIGDEAGTQRGVAIHQGLQCGIEGRRVDDRFHPRGEHQIVSGVLRRHLLHEPQTALYLGQRQIEPLPRRGAAARFVLHDTAFHDASSLTE